VLFLAKRSKEVFGHRLEAATPEAALQFTFDARREQFFDFHLLKQPECFADDFTGAGIAAGFEAGLQPSFLVFRESDFHLGTLFRGPFLRKTT